VNLLVLGDSLSDGGWERDPRGIGSAWPSALARLAAGDGLDLKITNRARGGSRSLETLVGYRESPELSGFDTVAVLVGANDLWRRWVPWAEHAPIDPEDYGRNLTKIVRLARERGTERVWILTPCLLHSDPDHEWNREMGEYREVCVRVARHENCQLVPAGEEFEAAVRALNDVKWTYDGVHPRPVGQERLAWTVYHHAMNGKPLDADRIPPRPTEHRLGRWP
jgi:lysophospholipase L1-like esterase